MIVTEIEKNKTETIRITREDFKGHELVHVRIWGTDPDGERFPTRQGIAIRLSHIGAVIDGLAEALEVEHV